MSQATFTEQVRHWADNERGMSEVAGAIFVLPFIAFLIFALVETGVNMRYRILVENTVETTVQGISNDGAVYWSRTSQPPITASNTWVDLGSDRLLTLCGTQPGTAGSRCKAVPTMDCSVTPSVSAGQDAVQVANSAGSTVTCTAEFAYNPVSPLSNSPLTSIGFSHFFNSPIKQTAVGSTVVGYAD